MYYFTERKIGIILIGVSAILLAMMVFYPMGYDQHAFSIGGEMIFRQGALPYRDFLDTKPPLIFYIYGFSLTIFGHSPYAVRVFDILYHFVSLIVFYRILRRIEFSKTAALVSVVLYTMLYTGSGFWMTAQAESYALLPAIGIWYLTYRISSDEKRTIVNGIGIGILSFILFYLKITLLYVPAAALIYLLYHHNNKTVLKQITLSVLSFIVLLLIMILQYTDAGIYNRWIESLSWVSHYADIDPLFGANTILRVYLTAFPLGIVRALSPLSCIIILWVLIRYRKKYPQWLSILIWMSLIGLLSVLYERKCFPYHYSRIFWSVSPILGYGLIDIFRLLKNKYRSGNQSIRFTVVIVCIAALYYSPLIKVIRQPIKWTIRTLQHVDLTQYNGLSESIFPAKSIEQIGDKYRDSVNEQKKIFFWGNRVGVYFTIHTLPTTIALTNTPLITKWTPHNWRDTMMAQLIRTKPTYIIVETGDVLEFITASPLDSYQQMERWTQLHDYIMNNYSSSDTVGVFRVFRRQTSF